MLWRNDQVRMRMEGQYKAVESASWANRFLDIQAPLIQDRMASESVDCNVTEKELTIPGENKKLDTKQDGTVDKRHMPKLCEYWQKKKNDPHYK